MSAVMSPHIIFECITCTLFVVFPSSDYCPHFKSVTRWSLFLLQNPYEAEKMVGEYLAFHYCPPEDYMKYTMGPKDALDFPLRCAELCFKHKPVSTCN